MQQQPLGEAEALAQAKNLALLYARAHTRGSYMACDSKYGNLIIPIVPRPAKESEEDKDADPLQAQS